jgi:hypothetical protein
MLIRIDYVFKEDIIMILWGHSAVRYEFFECHDS